MENDKLNNLSRSSNNLAANAAKMAAGNNNAELQELLEENLKYAKAIYWSTEKIRRYILWQRVYSVIKIIIIVVPLIIATIYLPPLLSGLFQSYMELLQK